jgi:ATP-dependent Clp protease ATP-binding subunit ClpC
MFERYTEKARRAIFFARYEASQYGSPYIESEHLLLGILREDKSLTKRFLRSHPVESIRKQIDSQTTVRAKTSTSVDLPLSNESKRVLAYAAEEAERMAHKHIGTEHLFLGLLREEKCFAAKILKERDVQPDWVREELAKNPQPSATRAIEPESPAGPFRDLTQEAVDGGLDPVVDRDAEIDCVIEILGGQYRKNAVLIGERGVGKTAIVEGLTQRIADGAAPAFLAEKRILRVESEMIAAWARDRQELEGLAKLIRTKSASSEVILFLDGLQGLVLPLPNSGAPDASGLFRYALSQGAIQCIAAESAGGFQETTQAIPWLEESFRAVHVRPLDEAATLKVLMARKSRLEEFHGVTYADEALEFAAHSTGKYLPKGPLPAKALELLDAAGLLVKLRGAAAVPPELTEIQKRIRFIVHRMEASIANHEFEKAGFYSLEEKKERENLRVLRETHKLDDSALGVVGLNDVEEMVARWANYPYCPSKE